MSYAEEMRAARALGAKDYQTVIEIYEHIFEEDEDHIHAPGQLAMCYEQIEDYENAIKWAEIGLAKDPTSYHFLMIAARYWSRKNDEDRTYHYACRVIESPQYSFEWVKKLIFLLFKGLSVFKKFQNIEAKARADAASSEQGVKNNLKWAKSYKERYEAMHGKPKEPTVH